MDQAEISFFSRCESFPKRTSKLGRKISRICSVDASYDSGNGVFAVAVLFENGEPSEVGTYSGTFTFPYLSGLFYLHEGPFAVAAIERRKSHPELVCIDAHGSTHPRSRGMATICGEVLGIPSIGKAKRLLVGELERYKPNQNRISFGRRNVGIVTKENSSTRYWSYGYSTSMNNLEHIIDVYKSECLEAMSSPTI